MDYNLEAIQALSNRPISTRLINISNKEETKFEISKFTDIFSQLEKEQLYTIQKDSNKNLEVFNKLESFQLSSSYIVMRLENYHKNLTEIKHQYLENIINNTKLLNRIKNIKLEIIVIKHLMCLERCYFNIEELIAQKQYIKSIKEINKIINNKKENYKEIKNVENIYNKLLHLKDKILYNIKGEFENKPLIYYLNISFYNNLNTIFKVIENNNYINVFQFILNNVSYSIEGLIYYYYKEVNKNSTKILGINKLNFHKKLKEKLLLDRNGYIKLIVFILFLQNISFNIIKSLFILFKSKNKEIDKQLNASITSFQSEFYNILKIFINGYRNEYKEQAIYFKLFSFVDVLNRRILNKDANIKLEKTLEYYFKLNKNLQLHSLTIDLLISDIVKCNELINEEKDTLKLNTTLKKQLFWYNFVDNTKRRLLKENQEQRLFSTTVFMKKLFEIINVFME